MVNRERGIEDAIIQLPEVLGFPGAAAIRNVRVAPHFGRIDLMLFPRGSRKKLVLVEAKVSSAPDALSKVVGQLLMYYAGAQSIGIRGLRSLRRFAKNERSMALGHSWVSLKQLSGGISPPEAAWAALQEGRKLRPDELALFVALNGEPSESLVETVRVLGTHHRLRVRIVAVDRGQPRLYQ